MKQLKVEIYAGVEITYTSCGYEVFIEGKYFSSSRKDRVLDFINNL